MQKQAAAGQDQKPTNPPFEGCAMSDMVSIVTSHGATVRVRRGWRCPCGRGLTPHDIEFVDADAVRLICAGCHLVLIEVEPCN